MAINIPIVTDFNSKGLQDAQNAFKHFQSKVGEAEGAFGKMKAGFGAAGDFIKANALAMASVAGTAIVGLAAKSVSAFQDAALSADKFASATGLSVEEASRWQEVTGDMGVSADSLQGALNKLNKAVGTNSQQFADLGIEIAKTGEGATDVNQTFLNTIEYLRKIEDPAERARRASELLGKGWQEVSQLVQAGANQLENSLRSVSSAKVIDSEEVRKAKEFRDAMDSLRDKFEDVALTLGSKLVPLLTDLIGVVKFFGDAIGTVNDIMGKGENKLAKYFDSAEEIRHLLLKSDGLVAATEFYNRATGNSVTELEFLSMALDQGSKDFYKSQQAMYEARYEALKLENQFQDVGIEWDILLDKLSQERGWINLQDQIARADEAIRQAFAENTPESLRTAELALISAKEAAIDYIKKIEDVPTDWETRFMAAIDEGNLEQVRRMLDALAKDRKVNFIPVMPGDTPSETTGRGTRRLSGTARADIFGPAQAGPNALSVSVNVAGSVTTENDLIEAIRKGLVSAQRNGSQLVYSNV